VTEGPHDGGTRGGFVTVQAKGWRRLDEGYL
jgi:hypothetical protein